MIPAIIDKCYCTCTNRQGPRKFTIKTHNVVILAFDGVVAGDLTMPAELFERVELTKGHYPYQVRVCASTLTVQTRSFDLQIRFSLDEIARADTLIVPGLSDPTGHVPDAILDVIRSATQTGARIASICTGAFVLAQSGVLDGMRATTHWKAADKLARQYPKIEVNPNVLFVDNGQILTSAGAAAGLDLCLHMIKQDHGASVAARAARLAVVPLERSGGQAQFIVRDMPCSHTSLSPVIQWIESRLATIITIRDMAEFALISTRTLTRRFQEQLGLSPLQWVIHARVTRAQCLLEATDLPIEHVAAQVGFTSSTSLREHFLHIVGTNPTAYRLAFRKAPSKLEHT
ncbi:MULTISPECIES: GlxA family transcriptional regulator [Pseudomonas syringae group]|uniref:AraC family regulatory protein n=1 Tax=Pseudomonas syringae pv. maculicola TaxID=59511 RepID=A0A0N0WYG1_PSEYM|nr:MULTISPECIES: helix-turn-helix domain-containing protein [Pseudomonas syringae group]KPC10968.1 AraC family regulatory protein [Pseudomonas amygdali pv. lachrymans]EGH99665.1 AraC family regulatory protein [Pseudomonas amygdali pv. lachrymans str. M302278]KPC10603.1 AraC family regulatory protein [Pseudomonas syringae pv. maculicola]MBM0212899.1 DJ-1/PfpI family protein [Pseudomonas syringae pv. maculicola]QQN24932.1 DJ-1/PfpI family protein [Pseudomonas syringae pv. maculicola]